MNGCIYIVCKAIQIAMVHEIFNKTDTRREAFNFLVLALFCRPCVGRQYIKAVILLQHKCLSPVMIHSYVKTVRFVKW